MAVTVSQSGRGRAVVGTPPSISPASESVFGAADALLVPVIPATLSSRTLSQLRRFLDAMPSSPEVLPYFSMVDRRKRLHRDLTVSLAAEWPDFLATVIASASVIERMGPERNAVATFAPRGQVALAFRELWAEVAVRLWS